MIHPPMCRRCYTPHQPGADCERFVTASRDQQVEHAARIRATLAERLAAEQRVIAAAVEEFA